jgi:hypothetical protein
MQRSYSRYPGALVQDPHAAPAQAVVAHREAVEGAHPAQHQVAERAGDELAVGLEQHHLEPGVGGLHVLGRRGAAPAAADDHDPA